LTWILIFDIFNLLNEMMIKSNVVEFEKNGNKIW